MPQPPTPCKKKDNATSYERYFISREKVVENVATLEQKAKGWERSCAKEDEDFITNGHVKNLRNIRGREIPLLLSLYLVWTIKEIVAILMEDSYRDSASQGIEGINLELTLIELEREMLEIKQEIHMIIVILDGLQNVVDDDNVEESITVGD